MSAPHWLDAYQAGWDAAAAYYGDSREQLVSEMLDATARAERAEAALAWGAGR